jgi:hypothetical protein
VGSKITITTRPVSTLDTHAMSYDVENEATGAPFVHAIPDDPAIPVYVLTIMESELFNHTHVSAEGAKIIDTILQAISLVPPVSAIARAAGRLRGTDGMKLGDSLIVATFLPAARS